MWNSVDMAGIVLVVYVTFSASNPSNLEGGAMTWFDSYEHCRRRGETLPPSRHTGHRSVWVFGLIVTRIYSDGGQKYIFVESWRQTEQARKCCIEHSHLCVKLNTSIVRNYTETEILCAAENRTLSRILGDSAHNNFRLGNTLGFYYWAESVNVSSFFTEDGFKVECLLRDHSGQLRREDCSSLHNTVCVKDDLKPVFYLPETFENITIPQYRPTSPNAGTSAFPPDSSSESSEGKGSSSYTVTAVPKTNNTLTKRTNNQGSSTILSADVVYTIAGMGAAVVITVFILGICCCCRRKRRGRDRTVMFDAYSDALDSIAGKEDPNLNSVYAVPEDTLGRKKAKPRLSISEDEYDVLGGTQDRPQPHSTGNVYSHISLGSNRNTTNKENIDDTYDVSNCTAGYVPKRGTLNDTQENMYEQISKTAR